MCEAEEALQEHLRSGKFLSGQVRGRWALLQVTWPTVQVTVKARDGRDVCLRFECSGYPDRPPTAMPWDPDQGCTLPFERWPRGGRVGQVFRPDWKNGRALYLPCDRESIDGHPNWYSEYPSLIWQPAAGLSQYLEVVSETLQSNELLT